jgi:vitamin B12 transporter
MKNVLLMLLGCLVVDANAQLKISGTVADPKGDPVSFANIYIEGSYDGTTTDSTGSFTLRTDLSGTQLLVVSCIGYEKYYRELEPVSEDVTLQITLAEQVSELNEVAITAGVFSASDKKKSATMTSFDIATTSSAMGDIYGAYATMPGSQKVGEEGMLFVRGGEACETKTYMDGMLVLSPYFSSMPDIPTRGRFSPLLFSETLFSTGGYSAEFGNALSAVVDLTTNGLETEDKASVGMMTVGANASFAKRWENTSLAMTGLYANNTLHHMLFEQNVDWIRDPVLMDGMVMFRQQAGETGLLKSFVSFNSNKMAMNYDNFEWGTVDKIQLKNHSVYANTSYSGQWSDHWLLKTGIAFARDLEDLTYNELPVRTASSAAVFKLVFTNLSSERMKIRIGGDMIREWYRQSFVTDTTLRILLNDLQPSLFIESELKITEKAALRLGARGEYSTLLEETMLAPRISAAWKTGKFSQVSLAWGKYRQKPENEFLRFAPQLNCERADHYILNFQYRKEGRTFRIESYFKKYDKLVKYDESFRADASGYSNAGSGFARGVDLFWRDQKSLKGVDYWISYSYLNTLRDYRDYPESAIPPFASAHNLSVVYKQFITPIHTFAGITYAFASGRPYDDKNSGSFMSGRTKPYNDISLSMTYVTRFFRKECIVHLNITNLFGFKNVYGYRYSVNPGENGRYASQAVVPSVGRQAVLLLMVSL